MASVHSYIEENSIREYIRTGMELLLNGRIGIDSVDGGSGSKHLE